MDVYIFDFYFVNFHILRSVNGQLFKKKKNLIGRANIDILKAQPCITENVFCEDRVYGTVF